MKIFGAVILFLVAFGAVILLVAFYHLRKLYLRIRQHITGDYDEETFKRMAYKHYRGDVEGPQFDKDYFKGTNTGGHFRKPNAQQQQKEQQRQTATTDQGFTIIDDRSHQERKKKIFTQDEGEYVEFTEE